MLFQFYFCYLRSKLEDIVQAEVAACAVTRVTDVFDPSLNFITLEWDMLVLCNQNKEMFDVAE